MTTPTTLKPATFALQTTFTVGSYFMDNSKSFSVADVNGDGNVDVVMRNNNSGNVTVLEGDGLGNFVAQTPFSVVANGVSVSVGVADVNGDSNADVITINDSNSKGTVSILLNDGRGNLSKPTIFAVGTKPESVSIGDLNGDGNVDVVTANSWSNDISVLLGDGRGNFAAQTTFAVGSFLSDVNVADVNGDSNADVITANDSSNNISVLLGDGRGSFAAQTTFAVGASPRSVNVVDVNGDGNADVVTANKNSNNISVLLGDGRGSFAAQTTFEVGTAPWLVNVADVNGDGNADVITANEGNMNWNPFRFDNHSISVLLGDGRGNFSEKTTFLVGDSPESVKVVDVNGDGKLDFVTGNYNSNNISILLNTTEGTFVAPSNPEVKPVVVAPVPVIEKPVVVTPPPVAVQHPHTGSVSISGNAIESEILSIQNTLKDEDGLGTFKYQWLQNGKAISGATKATYALSESDIGTAISVKVSYTDGLNKLESATSNATDLVDVKNQPPTYALSVDKTVANEGDTVTFNLKTENVDADTEIPFKFGGTISNTDVLGGLKTSSFVVDANGKALLAVKFIADKLTEGTENLTITLNSGENQSVSVKDTSLTPAPVVKPVVVAPVVVKPVIETPTGSKGYDKKAVILSGDKLIGGEKNDTLTGNVGKDELLGKAGNDKLIGLGGNDTLVGEKWK